VPLVYHRTGHEKTPMAPKQLAPHRAILPAESFTRAWFETLRLSAGKGRQGLLSDLREMAPLMVFLWRSEFVQETALAIIDVSAWWP
jgi:hypothetical protein